MKYTVHSNSWSYISVLLLAMFLFIAGCDNNGENPEPEPEDKSVLIESTLVYTASAAQIKLLAQFSGFGLNINEFKYDANVYKVTYKTTYNSEDITASGLIVLPKTTDEVAMISFQHGTITDHDDAPSNFSESDPNALLYGALSSSGFITVIPDYLGFGSSSSVLHPYYVEELTASAVRDMLSAAKELAVEKEIHFNKKLFLAGYSEGGYATMAVHKSIEEEDPEDFELVASFPGAGAYNIAEMQNYLFGLTSYDDPSFIAYLIRAYEVTFEYTTIRAIFFKEPYASKIPGLFDGTKSSAEINSQLTTNLSDLFPGDLNEKLSEPGNAYINDAFEANSLTDWAPNTKMFMYHGESDTTVPYENSLSTYESLISNGASESVLTLIPLSGDHNSALQPYILDFVPKLWALR